jgi:hypothetical protein
MEKKWIQKYGSNFHCPMCRTNLGMDIHDMNDRYHDCGDTKNYLDILENFWLKKEYTVAYMCRNNFDHFLGMKPNCKICESFISGGNPYSSI